MFSVAAFAGLKINPILRAFLHAGGLEVEAVHVLCGEAETKRYGRDFLVKAMVRPEAKVVPYEDAEREWNKVRDELGSRLPGKSEEDMKYIKEQLDPGLFAALRGYDALLKKSPYGGRATIT